MDNFDKMYNEPRPLHYFFGHDFLRDLVFQRKEHILPILAKENPAKDLLSLWKKIEKDFPEEERIDCSNLSCIPLHKVSNTLAVAVVSMPEAIYPTEIIHILILFNISEEKCRYITLEKSRNFLMVGEWSENGNHSLLDFGIKIAQHNNLSQNEFLDFIVAEMIE